MKLEFPLCRRDCPISDAMNHASNRNPLELTEQKTNNNADGTIAPHTSEALLSELSPLRETCSNTMTGNRLEDSDRRKSTTPGGTLQSNSIADASENPTNPNNFGAANGAAMLGQEGGATNPQNRIDDADADTKTKASPAKQNTEDLSATTATTKSAQSKPPSPIKAVELDSRIFSQMQTTPSKPPLAKRLQENDNETAEDVHSPASEMSMLTSDDLDDTASVFSTATSSTTKESFVSIVESAMENVEFDGESRLAKIWAAVSDEKKDFNMEDALTAAVTDLLNLQSTLHKTERELASYKAAAALPTDEEKYQMQIKALQTELEASQKIIAKQNSTKQRMICNMKKKKAAIEGMEKKLEACEKDLTNLTTENGELRRGLAAVCETRDSFKNRLRCQEDRAKEAHLIIQDLQKNVRRMQQFRCLELELLDHFRTLAKHTGLSRWGKPVSIVRI